MSPTAPIQPQAPAPARPAEPWYVRVACHQDVAQIAKAAAELLVELGGTPPARPAIQTATRALIEDSEAGALFVAEADGAIVGVLAASWQTAIHVPGRYALIQDLWVHPSWRSKAIGTMLLAALLDVMQERQIARVEVGLPQEGFARLPATQAFYRDNGFTPLGPRMRRVLS
jgi:GNAT superfamily N-acetyltransferase